MLLEEFVISVTINLWSTNLYTKTNLGNPCIFGLIPLPVAKCTLQAMVRRLFQLTKMPATMILAIAAFQVPHIFCLMRAFSER